MKFFKRDGKKDGLEEMIAPERTAAPLTNAQLKTLSPEMQAYFKEMETHLLDLKGFAKKAEARTKEANKEREKFEKDFHDTKTKLQEKSEEAMKLKREVEALTKSLKVFSEPKAVIIEELLGKLHETVMDVTKDIEMTDEQENQYQHIMGQLDEHMKQNEIQKVEALDRHQSLQSRSTDLELKVEDYEEKLKQLEEQNSLLREQVKTQSDKQVHQKVLDHEEFDKLQKEISNQAEAMQAAQFEVSKAKATTALHVEEVHDLQSRLEKAREELAQQAKAFSELTETHKMLENKYKHVKEKYAEAKEGNIKKYEARYRAKEKELENMMEAKYKSASKSDKENNGTGESPKKIEEGEGEKPKREEAPLEVSEKAEYEKTIDNLKTEIQLLKKDIEDLQQDKRDREDTIASLEQSVTDLRKKNPQKEEKPPAPAPQPTPPTTSAASGVLLNPKKVLNFLEQLDKNTKYLYKEFLVYSGNDPVKLSEMQEKMTGIIEIADDFQDYAAAKSEDAVKKAAK